MGIIRYLLYSNTQIFMETIVERLKKSLGNSKKVKKVIFSDKELKNELLKESDFLKGSIYDDINSRYKYLRIGGSSENYKCPYCGGIRKMGASALCDTCGSKECVAKNQHKTKIMMHKNMNEETKAKLRANMRKTCLERYGVEYSTQSAKMKEKSFRTKESRYGNPTFTNSEKRIETNKKKYGGVAPLSSNDVKKKMEETNMLRYGVKNVFQSEDVKENIKKTNIERYGVEYPMMSKEIQNKVDYSSAVYKQIKTKKRNGTLHTSSHEEEILKWLREEFGEVDKQYMDERYKNPYTNIKFKCDFYVEKYDLFIEYQGIYHHGKEPYDENNITHKEILKEWKEKSLKHKNSDYNEAIKVWTEKDPLKRKVAKDNNINFLELWSENGKCPSKETVIEKVYNFINK